MTPAIAWMSVVLPAPFAPTTATNSPRRDVEVDVVQHRRCVPRRSVRPRTSMSGCRGSPCGAVGRRRVASTALGVRARLSAAESAAIGARRCRLRLERCAQLARASAAADRARSPPAAGAARPAPTTGSQTPIACSSSARSRSTVVDRAVGDEPALLVEHDDPVDEADGRVEVVLDEQDRAVARRRPARRGRRRPLRCPAGRGSRSARRARAAASPSRARTRSRVAAVRRPRGDRGSRCAAPRGPTRRSAASARASTSATGIRRFSGPNATSSSSVPVTSCASGSWKTMPTRVLSSATVGARRCRRRRPRPCPRRRPAPRAGSGRSARGSAWTCPIRSGPSSSTTSPGGDVEGDGCRGRRASSPSWVIARSRTRSSGRRRAVRRGSAPRMRGERRIALECGHGSSQQE